MRSLWPLLLAGTAVGAGCGKSSNPTTAPPSTNPPPTGTPTAKGDGTIRMLAPAAMAGTMFSRPLDATLSPDGKTGYFIALAPDGSAAVFKTGASAPQMLASGAPLAAPFGLDVTADGKTLVIADPGAQVDPEEDVETRGQILTVSSDGGTATPLHGSAGYAPRAVVVSGDQIYFTGALPADRTPGVFSMPVAGGDPKALAMGEPLTDPSGIAVTDSGDVYVVDTAGPGTDQARLIQVKGGVVTVLLDAIKVGFPAGVALSQDDKTVLISALEPSSRTDLVIRYRIDSKESEQIASGIDSFTESAGLHRAKNADSYIWADSSANGGGTVYVINPQP